jgi:hypothetical protein
MIAGNGILLHIAEQRNFILYKFQSPTSDCGGPVSILGQVIWIYGEKNDNTASFLQAFRFPLPIRIPLTVQYLLIIL